MSEVWNKHRRMVWKPSRVLTPCRAGRRVLLLPFSIMHGKGFLEDLTEVDPGFSKVPTGIFLDEIAAQRPAATPALHLLPYFDVLNFP